MEEGSLDQTKLEDVGLDTRNHNISLSSMEVPSFDETVPQPQPLPNCPFLDVILGDERGLKPPLKPHSLDSLGDLQRTRKKRTSLLALKAKASLECDDHLPRIAMMRNMQWPKIKRKNKDASSVVIQNHFISDCPKNVSGDQKAFVVRQKVKLDPDEWIQDSGYTRHMTGNKDPFSSYKPFDGGNVLFGSNTKSKIIGKGKEVIKHEIRLCQIRKIPRSPTRQCPVHLRMGQTLVHQESMDHPLCQRTISLIMAAFDVPHRLIHTWPRPMYPEYIPQEDEILPAEEQPLPAAASPTADLPGYVPESDPEEEPEENDEDPEEDPADYPADRDDDDDDDKDEDEDEEEKEEHPAPADSVPPVERLLALTTPPPSPLTLPLSPLPHIPSPPFPASPPASPIRPLGYRAAMIQLRAETPSTSHPLPLPTSSPPLQLLSSDHRTDRPEITLPPWKRLGIDLGPRYEIGESSAVATTRPIRGRRADYGFVGTMDTEIRRQRAEKVGYGIRDVWDRQTQIYQSVETLFDDSQYHYETTRLLDQEALVSREAWGRSIEVSYMIRSEIMALRSVVMGQQAVISQLQAAHHSDGRVSKAAWTRKSLLSIMGYSQLADCIDLLFCLAIQYRSFVQKMAPKRKTTRLNPGATPTPVTDTHTTTSVTNAQIQAMINEGVTAALAARDATRNGDDSHTSGTGARRPVQVARECTYPDFLKCQPLNFKGTEGVVGLTQWFEKILL
ncbi:hypothetical protein Tco_0401520 [Tanacetum coccineum]